MNQNEEKQKHAGREKMHLLLQFLKPVLPFFAAALVFSMLNTVFNSLTPQVVKMTVDSILGEEPLPIPQQVLSDLGLSAIFEQPISALLLAACAVLIVAALSGICSYLSRMGIAKGSEGFVKALRDRLFSHIQKLPFAWHSQHQTGEIIQRCTSDVEVVRNFVCNQLVEVFRTVFFGGAVNGHYVFDECAHLADCAGIYPPDRAVFGLLLFPHCQALSHGR